MDEYILAHDLGTTGNKATLFSKNGELVSSCFESYRTYQPRPDFAEQDPEDWWEAVLKSTRRLCVTSGVEKDEIAVVSFSGQMMGCVPVDQKGQPLRRAVIWADQRSIDQAEKLEGRVGKERGYKITGHRISSSYSGTKIMWIRENEPRIFSKTHLFLQAKDFITGRLTGRYLTDFSDASGTNLFHLEKKEWSEEILEAAEIPRKKMPKAVPSTEIAGRITAEAAKEIGLAKDTPVVVGGGDGACAAAGAGVIREGDAYNYLGSSSWIALAAKQPIYDPRMRTFNWVHLDQSIYSPCGTMQSACGSFDWFKNCFCEPQHFAAKIIEKDVHRLLELEVRESPAGASGLVFLPYLLGERSPHWNPRARGAFIGINPQQNRADFLRAVMEGVSFNLKIILEALESQTVSIDEIRVIGGGAESEVWREIMADIYDKTIQVPSHLRQATSIGAAIAGGVGVEFYSDFSVAEEFVSVVKKYHPSEEKRKVYKRLYKVFKDSYRGLESVLGDLARIQERFY